MGSIPSYPPATTPLNADDTLAGWQGGKQVAVPASALVVDVTAETAANRNAAAGSAVEAALSAAAAESLVGPTYVSTAAGIAATISGQSFAVAADAGLVSIYRNTAGVPILQRTLATAAALAASSGAELVGVSDTETVADVLGLQVRVTTHGADRTSATDSSAPFNDAADAGGAGGNITACAGDFTAGSVAILDRQRWDGGNAAVQTTADTATIFLVDGIADWRISGFDLEGRLTAGVDPDDESETGLAVKNATRGIVSNMSFSKFKKVGLHRNAAAFTLGGAGRGARMLAYGLGFYECSIGLKTEPHGGNEYDVLGILHAGGCKIGMDLSAGNTIAVGFQSVDNIETNLRLRGGYANHAHFLLCAGAINHTKVLGAYLGHFSDITEGATLNAIHAYANDFLGDGPMFYERTGGINWHVGIADCWTFVDMRTFDTATKYPYNRQESLFLRGSYGPAQIYGRKADDSGWDSYSPYMIRRNCFGPGLVDLDGITTNDPADLYIIAEHVGAGSALAEGDFLKFPTSTGVGDRRKAHNPATGLVTIPKWMTGQYEYAAIAVVSGTLTTPTLSYLELVINPGPSEILIAPPFLPVPYNTGTALWVFNTGTISMHLTEGDVIGLRATSLTGSGPLLGHVSWRSQFWLKKIA